MLLDGFRCKQCGTCCRVLGIEYEIYVTEDDVRRWRREARDDILAWVDRAVFSASDYDFPVDPDTGDEVVGDCPFLEELPDQAVYYCSIHDTKPEDCARFPASQEDAARIGCPGFE